MSDEKDKDIVAKEIEHKAVELLNEIKYDPDLVKKKDAVKQAAQNVIIAVNSIMAGNLGTLKSKKEEYRNIETVYNFTKQYIKNKKQYLNLMKVIFELQEKANDLLNQKIEMVFIDVIKDENGRYSTILYKKSSSIKDDIININKTSTKRGANLTGTYSMPYIRKYHDSILEKSENTINLDCTFDEVYRRYKISREILQLSGGGAYIFWRINNKWDGVKIANAGPLGEAYLAFYLAKIDFNMDIEENVKKFMIDQNYGAIKADSVSGFLKGDVVDNNNNKMQYAVKTGTNAPVMGYYDIIIYATEILKATNVEKYIENLKGELNKEVKSNLVTQVGQVLDEQQEKIRAEIEKYINNKNYKINIEI